MEENSEENIEVNESGTDKQEDQVEAKPKESNIEEGIKDAEVEVKAENEIEPETDPKTDPKTDPETDPKTDPETDPKTEIEPIIDDLAKPESEEDSEDTNNIETPIVDETVTATEVPVSEEPIVDVSLDELSTEEVPAEDVIQSIPDFSEGLEDKEVEQEEQEEVFDWTSIEIDSSSGFFKIDESVLETLDDEKWSYKPIINKVFERLMKTCKHGYKFHIDSNRVNLQDYMKFYEEINRLIPSLKKKIILDNTRELIYFVGDTHGSIEDTYKLLVFFHEMLKKKPQARIIFVGDYVDRNNYDLQNLTLILAFYVIYSNNVILIRGNHEDQTINEYYGFFDNLLRRFYDDGPVLYQPIISFFKKLPLLCISQMHDLNGKLTARVLSVHGGIPVDPMNFMDPIILNDIEDSMHCEVARSEDMDNLSVSMLWSDPDEYIQGIVTDDGGSGRLQFGYPIFQNFMKANKLNLVVRGHQKWVSGYKIFFKGQLYSIFSASFYNNTKVHDAKILRLELNKAPEIIPIETENLNEILKKE